MKQLLVILNFLLLALAACPLAAQLQGMSLYPITLVNMQLNATVADYPIAIVNASAYSFAVAVTQVQALAPWGWNVTVGGNASTAIVTLRSELVNWVKMACVVWASNRADLMLGSNSFAPAGTAVNISSQGTTQTVALGRELTYPQASLVVVFINGFKMAGNASLGIKAVPFKVQKNSFSVNITTVGCTLSSVLISYAVFSPSFAAFQVFGDTFSTSVNQLYSFDVSQQIPNTPLKIWGFSQLAALNISNLQFQSTIDSDYVLSLSASTHLDITLQYLYFLPEVYSCPASCNDTIVFNGSCVLSCPVGTILTTIGDLSFCRSCSSKLGKVISQDGTTCACKEGYRNGTQDTCLQEIVKAPDSNMTSNSSGSSNTSTSSSNNTNSTAKSSTEPSNNTNTLAANSTNNTNATNISNTTINTTNANITNSTSNSTNTTTNCSKITNSMPINGKCLCLVGYVNLSNNCVPLVSLGSPFQTAAPSTSTPAIKASSACLDNQQFSITLNRCVCLPGFQLASNKCVSICSSLELYDNATGSCRCIAGFTRVNSVCNFCVTGNPNCYILTKQYCRNDFILFSGSCVSCLGISISNKSNTSCTVCSLGFVYNGSACVCPATVVNQTCVLASCGNKRIESGETCDDGNVINGDGCSSLCIIEMNFYCSGLPSLCMRTVLGNGIITGSEECDDGNIINGDGCSSQGLQQAGFTCVGNPSSCFNVTTGNLTLITVNQTTNNVYVIFQTPKTYSFRNSAFMQSFLSYKILRQNQTAAMIYCQQQLFKLNRFDCLLIFPSGVPLGSFIVQFSYNYEGTTGSNVVDFKYVAKSGGTN